MRGSLSGSPATVRIQDGGIVTAKLAADAVDAAKLKTDLGSLRKITDDAMGATATGAVGIGVQSPNARLEVGHFASAGTAGTGTANYVTTAPNTVTVAGGDFRTQFAAGDLIQLGNLGWKTVTAVNNATTLTIDSGYATAFNGNFFVRRATLRAGSIVQTGLGNVGFGTSAPQAPLHVANSMILDGANPTLYTGVAATEQNRYLQLINSPHLTNASGLKTGGLLVADTYSYANPGKNDAVIKGNLRVDGNVSSYCLSRKIRYEATCAAHGARLGYNMVATVSAITAGFGAGPRTGNDLCNRYVGNNGITNWGCIAVPYVYGDASSGANSGGDVRPSWSTCSTTFPQPDGGYPWLNEETCEGTMMVCCARN